MEGNKEENKQNVKSGELDRNLVESLDSVIGINTADANRTLMREVHDAMNARQEQDVVAMLGEGFHWRGASPKDNIKVPVRYGRKEYDINVSSIDVRDGHLFLRTPRMAEGKSQDINSLDPDRSWKPLIAFGKSVYEYRLSNQQPGQWELPSAELRARYDSLKAKPAFDGYTILVLTTTTGYSFGDDARKVAALTGGTIKELEDGTPYISFSENETPNITNGLKERGDKVAKARMTTRSIKITEDLLEAYKAGETNRTENSVIAAAARKDPAIMARIGNIRTNGTPEAAGNILPDHEEDSKLKDAEYEQTAEQAVDDSQKETKSDQVDASLSDQKEVSKENETSEKSIPLSDHKEISKDENVSLESILARHDKVKKVTGDTDRILMVNSGGDIYSFGTDAREISKILGVPLHYMKDSTSYVTFPAERGYEYSQRLITGGKKISRVSMPTKNTIFTPRTEKAVSTPAVHEDDDADTNVAALADKFIKQGMEPSAAEKKAKEFLEDAKRSAEAEKQQGPKEAREQHDREWQEARRVEAENERRREEQQRAEKEAQQRRKAAEARRREERHRAAAVLPAFLAACAIAAADIKEKYNNPIILNRAQSGKYYAIGNDARFIESKSRAEVRTVPSGLGARSNDISYVEIPEENLQYYMDAIVDNDRGAAVYDPEGKDVITAVVPYNDRRSFEQHKVAISNALAQAFDRLGDGEWINAGAKAAPRIYSKRQMTITPFNNILMAIDSDRHKYASNLYCTFNDAKEGGFSIEGTTQLQREKGLDKKPVNANLKIDWTSHNRYKPMALEAVISAETRSRLTDEEKLRYKPAPEEPVTRPARYTCIISAKEFASLPEEEKKDYEPCRQETYITLFNLDKTTMAFQYDALRQQYRSLMQQYGWKNAVPESSIIAEIERRKAVNPDLVVLAEVRKRTTPYYKLYGNDAVAVAKHFDIGTVSEVIGEGDDRRMMETLTLNKTQMFDIASNLQKAGFQLDFINDADRRLLRNGYNQLTTAETARKLDDRVRKVAAAMGTRVEVNAMRPESSYSPNDDTIWLGRSTDPSRASASENITHMQDVMRALIAATGNEKRLNRHVGDDLFDDDNRKFDALVQEIASAHYMIKIGLPARIAESHRSLIPYWQQELRTSPSFLPKLKKEVNNAVEVIDTYGQGRAVNYNRIRGNEKVLPNPSYTISRGVSRAASQSAGTFAYVKDPQTSTVHVVLPKGVSVGTPAPGLSESRIRAAFRREGVSNVVFHNSEGSLSLRIPNNAVNSDMKAYIASIKNWQLTNTAEINIEELRQREKRAAIKSVKFVKDPQNNRSGLFIQPEGEKYFTIFIQGENFKRDIDAFVKARTGDSVSPAERARNIEIKRTIGRKYYDIARQHPELKSDIVTPKVKDGVDINRISKVALSHKEYSGSDNYFISVSIDGGKMEQPRAIDRESYIRQYFFKKEDPQAYEMYKKQLGGVVFGDLLSKSLSNEQQQSQSEQAGASKDNTVSNSNDREERRPIRIHV